MRLKLADPTDSSLFRHFLRTGKPPFGLGEGDEQTGYPLPKELATIVRGWAALQLPIRRLEVGPHGASALGADAPIVEEIVVHGPRHDGYGCGWGTANWRGISASTEEVITSVVAHSIVRVLDGASRFQPMNPADPLNGDDPWEAVAKWRGEETYRHPLTVNGDETVKLPHGLIPINYHRAPNHPRTAYFGDFAEALSIGELCLSLRLCSPAPASGGGLVFELRGSCGVELKAPNAIFRFQY